MSQVGGGIGGQAIQIFFPGDIRDPAALGRSDHNLEPFVVVGAGLAFKIINLVIGGVGVSKNRSTV